MPRYYRKVINISALDSPNVQLALAEIKAGKSPSHKEVIPGVISYKEYLKRVATWDEVRQCIGIHGQFYKGAEVLMYPPLWLNRAEAVADNLPKSRKAEAIGIDPGEGVEDTAWAAVDRQGLIELIVKKTPDTSVIIGDTLAFMAKHGVKDEKVVFDRGGGGKQRADDMRRMGYNVGTIAFGEALALIPKRGIRTLPEKLEHKEEKYAYFNRRAEMYGTLREILDPSCDREDGVGYGIPREYTTLRQELAPIPLTYDKEGRLKLLPKNKATPNATGKTLVELIGHSPNCADALVLAVYALFKKKLRPKAGAINCYNVPIRVGIMRV